MFLNLHSSQNLPWPNQQIIGHRGIAGLAPENTLPAFERAKALGLNWVEFDTLRCKSGEWIVMHDETLERTTNGQGFVLDTSYEYLKTLDAGAWFSPHFKDTRIPLLSETLQYLYSLKIHPNIEIKQNSSNKSEDCKSFIDLLKKSWLFKESLPLVSSFDLEMLILLKAAWPELPIGCLVEDCTEDTLSIVLKYGFNSIHCNHECLDFSLIHTLGLAEKSIPLLTYTVNNKARIQTLLEAGVTAVFSDLTHI